MAYTLRGFAKEKQDRLDAEKEVLERRVKLKEYYSSIKKNYAAQEIYHRIMGLTDGTDSTE